MTAVSRVLEEHLQDTAGFFVDETRDTFDSTSAGQTTDGRLGDTLDVITQHLAMPLGASLSEPLASFTATSHVESDRRMMWPCCLNPYLRRRAGLRAVDAVVN